MFGLFKKRVEEDHSPSKSQFQKRDFSAAQNKLFFDGWTTQASSIDRVLKGQHTSLVARSREQVRNNPLMRHAANIMAKNVIGSKGITVHPKVKRDAQRLDKPANEAIKAAWMDWCVSDCDYSGQMSFVEMCSLWIKTAFVDGEFLFIVHNEGKYGLQIENIDPQLIYTERNQKETNGNITRLGVEYSGSRVAAIWLKTLDEDGNYSAYNVRRVDADQIYHCFIRDWANQSRGIPWASASLTRLKHLDAFDESALIAARAGASKMGFISGADDDDDEYDNGLPTMDFSPGTIEKLADGEEFTGFDPNYPSDAYTPFTKKGIRDVGAGMDISYASLSGDMSDVNYSSIRWGGQDERESFIDKQNWFIRCVVKPLYEDFIRNAVLRQQIMIGARPLSRPVNEYMKAHFQGRRWLSTDPQKEAKGFQMDLESGLISPQRIIASRGEDPEEILEEIREWESMRGVKNDQADQ